MEREAAVIGATMADKELVLHIGVESGGATVFRTPFASGGWEFHVGDSNMEEWPPSKPYLSIEDTLRSIFSPAESWVCCFPISIHPEYRVAVWELVQSTVSKLPDERKHDWNKYSRDFWQERCEGKLWM